MNTEQYAVAQAAISAAAAAYALKLISLFLAPVISLVEWLSIMQVLFPVVTRFREQSATLARDFYDKERAAFHPELPRNDQLLVAQTFQEFVAHMEPLRLKVQSREAPKSVAAEFALQFTREVEDAGRQQIVKSVEQDESLTEKLQNRSQGRPFQDVNRPVQGWARVATGRETCAFCLALISRGPIYKQAKTGGSIYDNDTTVAAYFQDLPAEEYMKEWHTGCDCLVIPVYDLADWPGMAAAQRALDLWIDAYDDAVAWREKYPDRKHTVGKKRGQEFTFNEDQILALRRRIDRGELNAQDWAVLNQAA